MYKILLVDDESLELDWLADRVNWEEKGLKVAAAVNSGFAALKVLQEQQIDVLLSDIKMPIMSGLELARRAKEMSPGLQIAFVSGHEDFHFARQAIVMNAHGYILKPVDDEELDQLLVSIVDTLDRERELKEKSQQLREAIPLVKNELVLKWLEGSAEFAMESSLVQVLDLLPESATLTAVIFEIDDLEWKLDAMCPDERTQLIQSVMTGLEQAAAGSLDAFALHDGPARLIVASPLPAGELHPLLDEIRASVERKYCVTVTGAVGPVASSPERLPESYRHAKTAIESKWVNGKNRILTGPIVKKHGEAPLNIELKAEGLFQAMLGYRLVIIDDYLEELFAYIGRHDKKDAMYPELLQVLLTLNGHFKSMNEDLFVLLKWNAQPLAELMKFDTVHDMKSWLRKRMFELSELLYTKQQKQNRRIVSEIIAFVDKHLESRITLKDVAHHFGFSPNHLGLIFKEETGDNFSNYLIRRRLDRACELLLDPTVKIYEITERIGYKNLVHFNRQFKNHVGMTPSEYRRKHKV